MINTNFHKHNTPYLRGLRFVPSTVYATQDWKRLSQYVRTLYPTCEYCNDALSQEGDHINGNTKDMRIGNIAAVCKDCHCTKTAIYEARGVHCTPATLYDVYSGMCQIRPMPPVLCHMWSPHTFLSSLIDQQRKGVRIDEILDSFAPFIRFTSAIDRYILNFLVDPCDENIQNVSLRLNVPLDCALSFTLARVHTLSHKGRENPLKQIA